MLSTNADSLATTLSILEAAVRRHRRVVFATSLGKEDMVLTDLIGRRGFPIHIFTLDTGKLHAETLALLDAVRTRYAIEIERVVPLQSDLDVLAAQQPFEAIYDSVAARRACCDARKVRPLARALVGADAWITGQRRAQSMTRTLLPLSEHDTAHGIEKLNPLALWTGDDVNVYLAQNHVPTNALHAQGFPSIGCAPCTRAVAPGEDERAGRWWWEQPEHKECGLHNNPRRAHINISTVSTTL
jgi:phosphoadenosine phosphosulfate reductase